MTINRLQLFQLITLNYCVLETAMIVTSTGNIGECLAHPVDQEIIYRPLQFDSLFFIIDFSARRGGGGKNKKKQKKHKQNKHGQKHQVELGVITGATSLRNLLVSLGDDIHVILCFSTCMITASCSRRQNYIIILQSLVSIDV